MKQASEAKTTSLRQQLESRQGISQTSTNTQDLYGRKMNLSTMVAVMELQTQLVTSKCLYLGKVNSSLRLHCLYHTDLSVLSNSKTTHQDERHISIFYRHKFRCMEPKSILGHHRGSERLPLLW